MFLNACLVGNLDIVKYLNGKFVQNNFQAVRLACQVGHLHILEYLHRESKMDIKVKSAVKVACENGHLVIVKYLFENGVEIRSSDDDLIYYATISGNLCLVKYLYDNGAWCDQRVLNFSLRAASRNGNIELVKYHYNNGAIDDTQKALVWATDNGHLSVVKYLYKKKISKDIYSALISASKNGNLEIVEYLVSVGAIINEQVVKPTMFAGRLDIIKFFYDNGIDIMKIELSDEDFEDYSDNEYEYENYKHCQNYITFLDKMKTKIRERAQKKIYFWWIPICYDMNRDCGQRMMLKNLEKAKEIGLEFV